MYTLVDISSHMYIYILSRNIYWELTTDEALHTCKISSVVFFKHLVAIHTLALKTLRSLVQLNPALSSTVCWRQTCRQQTTNTTSDHKSDAEVFFVLSLSFFSILSTGRGTFVLINSQSPVAERCRHDTE